MIPLVFLNTLTLWLPPLAHVAIFGLIVGLYSRREKIGERYPHLLISAGLVAVVSRVFYSLFLTMVQYWIWSKDSVGAILLEMPLREAGNFSFLEGKLSYFLFYALERYWFDLALSLLASLIFFIFLKFLEKYRERFFDQGETVLGGALAFVVGWPQILIFVGLSFLVVVGLSIIRMVERRGRLTTLGLPLLLSAPTALFLGDVLVPILGLSPFLV